MFGEHQVYATLPAADLERAKTWYRDKLGLSPAGDMPGAAYYNMGGGSGFLLFATQFGGTAQNTAMGIRSSDMDADVAALRAKGVVIEEYDLPGLKTVNGIADMGGFRSAWFKDSEGNTLGISDGMG